MALQLQSRKEIEKLTSEYQDLQQEAEQNIAAWQDLKAQVEERRKALPKLRDDARALKNEEEFQRIAGRFSLRNARDSFDETAREIQMKKLQAQSRNALEADPHADLDKRIQRALQGQELEDAMQALRQKVGRGTQTVVVVKEDSVAAARKLLEAPRANPALPAGSRGNTPVRNR